MIKEIWCMPHSHLDIGYTHPQPMLMELQADYVTQALELVEKTRDYPEESRFRWTIEANCVLERWAADADEKLIARMQRAIAEGCISIAALPMHTTPGCDARELVDMMSELGKWEKIFNTKIKVAVSHDVNGQPWPLGQVLLDSGVDFYLTGINIHYGGVPFQRPCFFQWEMADGRKLPTYLGEHYSMFSVFAHTQERSPEKTHAGLCEHAKLLESRGYRGEIMFLTATNPPLMYDNNCPDIGLPDLIRAYNESGYDWKIKIVTADMLRERMLKELSGAPVYGGDWTDYWNFGCGSTARETGINRRAKDVLSAAEMLEGYQCKQDRQYTRVKRECRKNILTFDEHTWGAYRSVSEPECMDTRVQSAHKAGLSYQAADLAGYLLGRQLEAICENPWQSEDSEGILLVNPTQDTQILEIRYPADYQKAQGQMSAVRCRDYVPYLDDKREMESGGIMTVDPFSLAILPYAELNENKKRSDSYTHCCIRQENKILTPYYEIEMNESGGINQVWEMESGKELLNRNQEFCFFDPVRESIAEGNSVVDRSAFYGDSVTLREQDIPQWKHDWKAQREIWITDSWEVEEGEYDITLVTHGTLNGIREMTRKIIFYSYTPYIRVEVEFIKEAVTDPEALYLAIPLAMKEDWQCCYDTAGQIAALDEEQLGHVCRDYITVDTGLSIYEKERCITLACPDAPMVQVGDFQFARENKCISRKENPLLLAWLLNNYWSTNFAANQEGKMRFAYEFGFNHQFDCRSFRAAGVHAKQPVYIDAAVKARKKKSELIQTEGKTAILNIFSGRAPYEKGSDTPADTKNLFTCRADGSINILLMNQGKEEDLCRLKGKAFSIYRAAVVNPQEEELMNLEVEEGWVSVKMPAGALRIIKVYKS